MGLEIARRWIGGRWRTGVADENGNGGSHPAVAVVLARPITFADTDEDGVVLDVCELTAGDFLMDILMEVTTAWNGLGATGSLAFGLGIDPDDNTIWIGSDTQPPDTSSAVLPLGGGNSDTRISGNGTNGATSLLAIATAINSGANGFLPGRILQTCTLQAKYNMGDGLSSAGAAIIRVVKQAAPA